MKQTEITNNLNHLGDQVKAYRKDKKQSGYYLSQLCDMGSGSGLRHLERGGDIRVSTLIKLSKNLNINISIIDGLIVLN